MTDHADLDATDAAPPASNWRPTPASVAVVVLCTVAVGALVAEATNLWNAVAPAAVGAVLLAAAVSFAATTAYRPLSRFVAACLLLPAGAGVVAGLGYTLAKQLGGVYPVGSVFVVLGLTAAGFGAAAAVRDTLEAEALSSALTVATVASLPPTLAFVPLAVERILAEFSLLYSFPVLVTDPVTARAFPGAVAEGVLRFLVAPTHDGPHLLSFAVVCYVGVVGLAAVLRTYPVADLLRPSDPDAAARVVEPVERAASLAATLGVLVVVAAGVLLVSPSGFEVVPARVRDPLTALAGVGLLRVGLLLGGVAGLGLAAESWGLRRLSDSSRRTLDGSASPFLAGVAVVAGAVTFHAPVLATLVEAVLDVLPATLAGHVRTQTDAVVAFYGGEVVLLGLSAGVFVVTAVAVAFLYATVRVGAVTDRAAGAAVAGTGLFVASAVSAGVGASTALVFAGVVAGLVVRDAGTHGVTLGHEVGRLGGTRRAELVHLCATLAVGLLGVLAAVAVLRTLGRLPALSGSMLPVALGGAVLGAVALAVALR